MATVFVTQTPSRFERGVWVPKVNLAPAKEFGALRVMVPPGMNFTDTEGELRKALDALREFDPEHDYLLPAADPLVMIAAAAMLGKAHGAFRILRWDRHSKKYFPCRVAV